MRSSNGKETHLMILRCICDFYFFSIKRDPRLKSLKPRGILFSSKTGKVGEIYINARSE